MAASLGRGSEPWEGLRGPGARAGPLGLGSAAVAGGLGLFLLSSSGEPYVRTLLGKQEVQLAKFSTGSITGLVPARPAQP